MALNDKKITESGIAAHGVSSAPDRLTGTAAENKKVFDNLVREVVAESVNGIVDELTGEGGAEQIGIGEIEGLEGANVKEALASMRGKLSAWEKQITGSVINVPVDEVPTEGSVGVPSSGGTWAAIQGKAPGGFGLGEEAPKEVESADDALASGWYVVGGDEKALLLVESMDENTKKQTMHSKSGSQKREMRDGVWGAWVGFDRVGDVVFSSRNMEVETDGAYIAMDGRTIDGEAYEKLTEAIGRERVPEPASTATAEVTEIEGIQWKSAFLNDALFYRDVRDYLVAVQADGTRKHLLTAGSSTTVFGVKVCNGEILATYGKSVKVYGAAGNEIRTKSTGSSGNLTCVYSDGHIAIVSDNSAIYRSVDNFETFVTAAGLNGVGLVTNETSLHKPVERYGDKLYIVNGTTVYQSVDDGVSWTAAFTITTDLGEIVTSKSYSKHFIHDGYLYFLCNVASAVYLLKIDLASGECVGHTEALAGLATMESKYHLCGAVCDNTAYCAIYGRLYKIDLATMSAEVWEVYPGVTSCNEKQDTFTVNDVMFLATDTKAIPDYHKTDGTGSQTVCIVCDLQTGKSVALYNSCGWDLNGMAVNGNEVWFATGTYADSKHTNSGLHKIDLTDRVLPEIDFGYIKAMEG